MLRAFIPTKTSPTMRTAERTPQPTSPHFRTPDPGRDTGLPDGGTGALESLTAGDDSRRPGWLQSCEHRPPMSGRRLLALLVLLLPVVLTAGLGVAAGYAVSRAIRIPRVSELATYRPDIVTEIRGADGSTIARYAIERRVLVSRTQIP